MALYVKDREVSLLAEHLAELRNTSKTEVIRQALRHELEREGEPSLADLAVAFSRKVRALGNPEKALPVDKAFIDSLYEREDD